MITINTTIHSVRGKEMAILNGSLGEYYQPIIACIDRAKQEMIIKDFPQAVISTLTLDVATSLAQSRQMD